MPRNFSELKSGDNSYAVPHAEKWGRVPPSPTDRRRCVHVLSVAQDVSTCFNRVVSCLGRNVTATFELY